MIKQVCTHCMSYMRYYPEFTMEYKWLKCPTCGYTKEVKDKNMITLKELNPNGYETTAEIDGNLQELLTKLNRLRKEYGLPMFVTSGLRDMKKHLAIYEEKNKKLKEQGLPEIKVPMGSLHLRGLAVDFADKDGKLWDWIQARQDLIEELDLYFEDKAATPGWTHIQIRAPKSGKRIFKP